VEHKNITFKVWDLAGQKGIRPFWRSYYKDTKSVIFVIDATDRERLATAKEELLLILEVSFNDNRKKNSEAYPF
jgi:ADP-ribosylation factor-like protein 1